MGKPPTSMPSKWNAPATTSEAVRVEEVTKKVEKMPMPKMMAGIFHALPHLRSSPRPFCM